MRQKNVKAYYPKTSSTWLGIAHIVLGLASICLTIALPLVIVDVTNPDLQAVEGLVVSVVSAAYFASGTLGIWGLTAIITGILALLAASKKTTSQISAHMVMAIITCFFATIDFVITSVFLVFYCTETKCFEENEVFTGVLVAMAIAAGLEVIASFWSATMSCRFVCSRGCKKYCCTCYENPEVDVGVRSVPMTVNNGNTAYGTNSQTKIQKSTANTYGYGNPMMMNGYSTVPSMGYGYGAPVVPAAGYSAPAMAAPMGYSTLPMSTGYTGFTGNYGGMYY